MSKTYRREKNLIDGKRNKNPAGFSQSKTKNKRVAGFDPEPIKTNWFFTPKPE